MQSDANKFFMIRVVGYKITILTFVPGNEGITVVAVKTLKENASDIEIKDLSSELQVCLHTIDILLIYSSPYTFRAFTLHIICVNL